MDESPEDLNQSVCFRAGWLAAQHGWPDAELLTADGLDEALPTGPPLVAVMRAAEITADVARSLAAMAGAGRPVALYLSEGDILDDARQWITGKITVLNGPETDETTPSDPAPATEETRTRPAPPKAPGHYCHVSWNLAGTSSGGTWANKLIERLVRELKLKGVREGCCFAALFPSVPDDFGSWVEFSLSHAQGREWVVIETPIGVSASSDRWTQDARDAFAWHVLQWAEQPAPRHARGIGRLFGHKAQEASGLAGSDVLFRSLSYSSQFPVVRLKDSIVQVAADLEEDQNTLFLEYRLPVLSWPTFRDWTVAAMTSLHRVLHLLEDPGWSIWDARDTEQGHAAIGLLLDSQGLTPFGSASQAEWKARQDSIKAIAMADGALTEEEFEAFDPVEVNIGWRPSLNQWPQL